MQLLIKVVLINSRERMTMNSRAIINSEQGWWGTPRFSWIFSDYDESVLGYSLEVLREDLFFIPKREFLQWSRGWMWWLSSRDELHDNLRLIKVKYNHFFRSGEKMVNEKKWGKGSGWIIIRLFGHQSWLTHLMFWSSCLSKSKKEVYLFFWSAFEIYEFFNLKFMMILVSQSKNWF